MRIRLTNGAMDARLGNGAADANSQPMLDVTRTQHEQRSFPVVLQQSVVIGVRRIHVLPTPLSSYTVCAPTTAAADGIATHPFLAELAQRMKTRITARVEPNLAEPDASATTTVAPVTGVAVLAGGANCAAEVDWVLRHGAAEFLLLPADTTAPQRVLIHWVDEASRRATLAVAASLLRHVSAEAVYVGILPPRAGDMRRPQGVRALLDARSEAQAMHGLEMRTELHFGNPGEELKRQLDSEPAQMLILGVSDPADLRGRFGDLLATSDQAPDDGRLPFLRERTSRRTPGAAPRGVSF